MTPEMVMNLVRQALEITILVSAPLLLTALVTGLLVSVFQAATQINEMTLSFIPKLLAIFLALVLAGPWMVNLMVFTSILVMVLLTNLAVQRTKPFNTTPLFAALLASLGIAYVIPVSDLLWLGTLGQWVLGGLLVALPVLFASLIFSTLLAQRIDPARALAYNLLGAIVGGALEYTSLAMGIKALYLLAGAVYGAALLASLRRTQQRAA